jgi:hypothetical protein
MSRTLEFESCYSHLYPILNFLMAASRQKLLSSIGEPNVEGGRLLTTVLQQSGIPCVLWGVSAAVHYGGGLCPLVSRDQSQY